MLRLMEGVSPASLWRIASAADTGAGSAVWGVLPADRGFSEEGSVPFMGGTHLLNDGKSKTSFF